jgi:trimethylamine corrinoid protein
MESLLKSLEKAVIDGDEVSSKILAEKAIQAGIDPVTAIKEGLIKGMDVVNKGFKDGDLYLPEFMLAADAMAAGVSILKKYLKPEEKTMLGGGGKVVLGTALGDVHDIGKTLVMVALSAAGWEIFDLGIDVPTIRFIEKAVELNADIIGVSSLLSSSATYQKDVITELEARNLRQKYFVIVGGGATSSDWAKEIKADGWGDQMHDAVELCKKIWIDKIEMKVSAGNKCRRISFRYKINEE